MCNAAAAAPIANIGARIIIAAPPVEVKLLEAVHHHHQQASLHSSRQNNLRVTEEQDASLLTTVTPEPSPLSVLTASTTQVRPGLIPVVIALPFTTALSVIIAAAPEL
jgi:hypothetical protein